MHLNTLRAVSATGFLISVPSLGVAATTCEPASDTSCGTHSAVFAIAHDYNDPASSLLYRVSLEEQPTTTAWGDGVNGFFYRVSLDGGTSWQNWVPFNGIGSDSGGAPTLRPFSFVVKAPTSATALTLEACASNYKLASGSESEPACDTSLWQDAYASLPQPAVGASPIANMSLELPSSSVQVHNNGVYGTRIVVKPEIGGEPAELTADQISWLYDHLVFLDPQSDIYTNDVFADGTSSPSFAALAIEEAAFQTGPTSGAYVAKFGPEVEPVEPVDPTVSAERQFWVYTTNTSNVGGSQAIPVTLGWLYDASASCPGALSGNSNSTAASCAASAEVSAASTPLSITVFDGSGLQVQVNPDYAAGARSQRTVTLEVQDSHGLCTTAVNPLAVDTATAINLADYVIRDELATGKWEKSFPPALYYVLPTGFGNCDPSGAPFCEQTTGYSAYIPHYLDSNGQGGVLNGGSTDQRLVGSFILADQYRLPALSDSDTNSLTWFDNCGYGHVYSDSSLSGRNDSLPTPPSSGSTFAYQLVNAAERALVLAKDCCASFYQQNTSSCSQDSNGNLINCEYDPPEQIGQGFGMFLAQGTAQAYQTLFGNEAFTAYDAASGNALYRFSAGNDVSPRIESCATPDATLSLDTSASPHQLRLYSGSGGTTQCTGPGPCPNGLNYGFTVFGGEPYATCISRVSGFILNLDLWRAQESVAASPGVVIEAWGGSGQQGSDSYYDGGSGGGHGFAQSVLAPDDVPDALFAYVGEEGGSNDQGGASTIMAGIALSSRAPSTWANASTIDDGDVYLIAGGGGGGGYGSDDSGFDTKHTGGNGGGGGVAIANATSLPGSSVAGAGQNGNDYGDQETGGRGGSRGTGGSGAANGANGIGGFSDNSVWTTGGSLVPPASWSPGSGGSGKSGNGGGGFGGGGNGGGGGSGQNWGHGGGGGGSWAIGNTAHLGALPTPTTGAGGGAVAISYPVPCESPACAPAGKLEVVGSNTQASCVAASEDAILLETANSYLRFFSDGELALYLHGGSARLWGTSQYGTDAKVCFLSNGSLEIQNSSGSVVWSVGTSGGQFLTLKVCTLAIIDGDGKSLWSQDENSKC